MEIEQIPPDTVVIFDTGNQVGQAFIVGQDNHLTMPMLDQEGKFTTLNNEGNSK